MKVFSSDGDKVVFKERSELRKQAAEAAAWRAVRKYREDKSLSTLWENATGIVRELIDDQIARLNALKSDTINK